MTVDLKEFQALQAKVEQAKAERSKAEGVYSQLMSQLKEEFACESLEEADTLRSELAEELEAAEAEYADSLAEFKQKFPEIFAAIDEPVE